MIVKTTEQSTEARLIEMISGFLNISPDLVHPYTHIKDDLDLDPIDWMLLLIKLENQFGVYLTPEEADSIETIRDIGHCLLKHAA